MTSSHRAWAVGLVAAAALLARASAEVIPTGLTLQLVGKPAATLAGSPASGVVDDLVGALNEVLKGAVSVARQRVDDGLMDNLPRLPEKLSDLAAAHPDQYRYRYVFCLRPQEGGRTAEVAVVDLVGGRLLGYQLVSLKPGAGTAQLRASLATLARETLPVSSGSSSQTQAAEGETHLIAAGDGRDAPDDSPVPVARFVPSRPRPVPVGEPAEPEAANLDELLRQFAGQALSMGGLGRATSRPRVLDDQFEFLLLPAGPGDPAEPPVRAVMTVYAEGEQARVETRFSRPVKLKLPGRSGTWIAADVKGYQVETDTIIDVGRSGLLNLHIKPLTGQGSRIGFQLTGAGEVELEATDDGKILLATIYQSEERAKLNERVAGANPWDGQYRAGRSFRGQASWYGGRWHGRATASGERYNQWGWTAAHKTLPLGTWVKVTNLRNGRQAVLRINDRGPYIRGRVLDVSAAAAQALGFYGSGVAPVEVEVLSPAR